MALLGFPFAKLLRNYWGTKRKIFLSLCISFARKNNNLRNHPQKSFRAKLPYSAFAKLKFCAILQLEFCAIPQFRKTQTVGDGVFLRIQFWKNLVLECLPIIGHFYIIDQWQLRRVQISQFSRQFKFWTCIFPKSGFFRHWLLSCIILYEIKKISEIWLKKFKNIIHTWLGKALKGHLKLFNRIKILPSFTLSNFYFINFGPLI